MVRKIANNLGYIGLLALFGGYFYYSVHNIWDWRTQAAVYGGLVLLLVYLGVNLGRIREGLKSRTGRYGGTAFLTLVLVLGILMLANFINFRHHKRVDLTEGQLHALSPQSRKIVESLPGPVQIIGFFQAEDTARRFLDLMQEYRYVSTNIEYESVDPQKDPGRAAQYEIERAGQVVVLHAGRKEVVDQFSEETITNALIRVTREETKKIVFLQGHGERDIEDSGPEGYSTVRDELKKQNYEVVAYNLAQEGALPENPTVLVSAGPQVNFFPNEVPLLEEYLAKGGKFFLLVDPQTDFSMEEFLAKYGLKLDSYVVIDASGLGQLFGLGAGAPLVSDYTDHPITREVKGVMSVFPMAQSVSTVSSPLDYRTETLLKSSSRSWGETDLGTGRVSFDETKDARGPLSLAAVATKKVSDSSTSQQGEEADSSGAGEEDTSEETEVEAAGDGEDAAQEPEEGDRIEKESRFLLFGDSDFAANAYFHHSVNGDLFLNAVSWLAEDIDLVSIRPKDPENRSVNLSASESKLIFWGTVVFLPLLTLILGITVWYRRR